MPCVCVCVLVACQAPTIVFGADVNHPGAGNVSKPSIAAVVASMDRWVSRHGSCVAVQEHRKEVIQVCFCCSFLVAVVL